MVQNNRRNLMKGMAAASGLAAVGATGNAAASEDDTMTGTKYDTDSIEPLQNFSDTITWEDSGFQGSGNARLCCPANTEGVWNWNLTGGGSTFVEAELTVTFEDGTEVTAPGEFPGVGNLAQFDIVREFEEDECLVVESAEATFTLTNSPMGTQVLTISSSECLDDVVPPKPPKDKKKERREYEKKRNKHDYLRKKLRYKQRKENYKEAKKEYKEAKKAYDKNGTDKK